MENYNEDNLKIGGLAIIINTYHPENRHLIGRTVTIEDIVEVNEAANIMWFRQNFNHDQFDQHSRKRRAIISGVSTHQVFIDDHSIIATENLMPIGDDDLVNELFSKEENPYFVAECA